MDDNSFKGSEFDAWKKGDVARLKKIEDNAELQVRYMSEESATEKLHELTKRGQGVTTRPLLNDEEKALRRALLKRFKVE